jgi:AcrR family transcriptional regulator
MTRLTASERRLQLIKVGRSVFAEQGYEATTVEEVARRAKVSKPIVYEHFGGKEGLYAVIVDREMGAIVERISAAIGTGTGRDRLEGAVAAFLGYVKDEPDGFQVLLRDRPHSRGGMSGLMHELAERVGAVFEKQFVDAGYDRRLAALYAHALVGMVAFVGEWWTEEKRPAVDVVASHVTALAWMGLRRLPKQPRKIDPKRFIRPPG